MPARRFEDPLVNVTLKVSQSLRADLQARAKAAQVTLSDILRSHLTLAAAKPLGKAVPHRRPAPKLARASGADPALLRQLAAIGSNLNQIARVVNGQSLAAKPLQALELLTLLRSIERQIGALPGASKTLK
jgi:hypothetical protein